MADPNDLLNALNLKDASPPVQLALALGLSALIPAALMTLTCFTRVVIVLSFVRQGLATQNLPPNQVLIGLALFLSAVHHAADVRPRSTRRRSSRTWTSRWTGRRRSSKAAAMQKKFMLRHTRTQDLALFLHMSRSETVEKAEDTPFFTAGAGVRHQRVEDGVHHGLLHLPAVPDGGPGGEQRAHRMGMVMMPPVTISAPFKVLLFVLADGWHLVRTRWRPVTGSVCSADR